ncbi:MAG: hypothetical protein P4L99_13595 [Chthoniobacter sp.]|nr:hypothetical protein [Chthoniobacter sp.]
MKNSTQDPFVQAGEIHASCLEDNTGGEHSAREAHFRGDLAYFSP